MEANSVQKLITSGSDSSGGNPSFDQNAQHIGHCRPPPLSCIYFMDCKILFWNCRGAVSEDFLDCLCHMLREHKPCFLILAKTRTSN